ncbi:hypothetical protein Pint_21074 [Pistacia integerrima]|uniref:Uncharacterized protein n=1 Tax=Pistacia integerrima TaxID=434235 RepID=A0ACC0XBQ8_9ROSI|nr:hypothetical protein Pint_21074 [Pistacia integerrima]
MECSSNYYLYKMPSTIPSRSRKTWSHTSHKSAKSCRCHSQPLLRHFCRF